MQVVQALIRTGSLVVLIEKIGLSFCYSEPIIHCRAFGQRLLVEVSNVNAKTLKNDWSFSDCGRLRWVLLKLESTVRCGKKATTVAG